MEPYMCWMEAKTVNHVHLQCYCWALIAWENSKIGKVQKLEVFTRLMSNRPYCWIAIYSNYDS